MGGIPEIVWQGGAAAIIVAIVLTKVAEIVKHLVSVRKNNTDYAAQPEMCKSHHEQVIKILQELHSCVKKDSETLLKLWSIHNQYDEDGAPKWYTTKTMKMLDDINRKLDKL